MTKKWIIALLLLPAIAAGAQGIRLTNYDAPNALYFNADRFFDFNLYERARFGASLLWVSPNENAARQRKVFGQWTLSAYGAYATGDKDWKYGLGAMLRLPGACDPKLRLWAFKDLERAAWRRLGDYTMLTPASNTNLVASRFIGVRGADFDFIFSPSRSWDIVLGISQKWEDYRFGGAGLLYPALDAGQQAPIKSFSEIYTEGKWYGGFRYALYGGIMADRQRLPFFRGIAQYNGQPGGSGLNLFAQAGFATRGAPYSRMFDLSGTAFSLYYFKNSFLTIRPNTLTANIYSHICLNYTAPLPLWSLPWSKPRPFLQANALWGMMFDQDELGCRHWDGLDLQAPSKGIFEVATGFDGFVYWGLMDVGFAVAYQLCPSAASYRHADPAENFAFTIVANFILDKHD